MILSAPELNLRRPPREKDEADRAFAISQARGNGANGNGHGPDAAKTEQPEAVTSEP